MDDKDQIRILLQALAHLRSAQRVLREALDQHNQEAFLQQWGRRLDRERRLHWLQDARN
jgi:hypothetical protein